MKKTFTAYFTFFFVLPNFLCGYVYSDQNLENVLGENDQFIVSVQHETNSSFSDRNRRERVSSIFSDPMEVETYRSDKKTLADRKNIVISSKKINLKGFPKSFNPSILKTKNGFLLTFRYLPDPVKTPWISYIGIVQLDNSLNQISEPQLLDTRAGRRGLAPSQSEDARIFSYNGSIYVIYNDNEEITSPTSGERRDIFIAKLEYRNKNYSLSTPMKLCHDTKYNKQLWQKNWMPFVWNKKLLLSYSLVPHEILCPNLEDGSCAPCYETQTPFEWKWGILRGGTPALLVDGEYLAFFHSLAKMSSKASNNTKMYHYFMGAYTFSATPPFSITKITPKPIIGKNFYTKSSLDKRVIYPGGYAIFGSKIYVAYGKDDCEVWVAVIDKKRLKNMLRPIK